MAGEWQTQDLGLCHGVTLPPKKMLLGNDTKVAPVKLCLKGFTEVTYVSGPLMLWHGERGPTSSETIQKGVIAPFGNKIALHEEFPTLYKIIYFFVTALRYNSHAMQVTHLKCAIQFNLFFKKYFTCFYFFICFYIFRIRAYLKNTRESKDHPESYH